MIKIFKRRAWTKNPSWPEGFEPMPRARKTHVCYVDDATKAREVCREYNKKRTKKDDHFYEWVG